MGQFYSGRKAGKWVSFKPALTNRYRACVAEKAFLRRSKRPKPLLLADNPALRMIVTHKLESDWSPEQISGWLKHHSPDGKEMYVSHETIYKSLFIQTRGVFREELKSTYAPNVCFAMQNHIKWHMGAKLWTPFLSVSGLQK